MLQKIVLILFLNKYRKMDAVLEKPAGIKPDERAGTYMQLN